MVLAEIAARADRNPRGNVQAKAEVTEEAVSRFATLMRRRLTEEDTPARKALLTSIIDKIEVDHGKIRIRGRKDVLEQCVVASTAASEGVRTFVPKWRTGQEPSDPEDSGT